MKVPIRNLYYILCFAWKAIPERIAFDLTALDTCEDVINLCAYVLTSGIDHLLRRGLDRGYLLTEERTSRLRGRILITQTVKHRNLSSPTAICEFDEFSPNIPHNQILRSTVADLLRSEEISAETRKRLEISFRQLAGIDTIAISNELFRRVQLHRNNRHYAFLLFACQLLHLLKLPDKDSHGHSHFNDLLDDEKTMERVFEEFLRNFYRFKQTEFSDVSAAHLDWSAESLDGGSLALLPEMKTDTPIPVLAPGNGKTKTGRLWTYVRDDRPAGEATAPAVWFAYSEDRRGEHPRQHLKRFRGALQADAFAGFHHLYGQDIYEAGCWAHARRKFHEIHVVHASPTTTEALARIGALYAIEDEIRGKPVDVRLNIRQARAKPLLSDLRTWMEKAQHRLSSKSETAGAIRYALSRWRALTRYTDDGLLEIDNSAAERALRAVALGRKNFLFAGSNSGGERAAAMYSLIGSATDSGRHRDSCSHEEQAPLH